MINDAYVLVTIVGFLMVMCVFFKVKHWRVDHMPIPPNKFPKQYKGMETIKKL